MIVPNRVVEYKLMVPAFNLAYHFPLCSLDDGKPVSPIIPNTRISVHNKGRDLKLFEASGRCEATLPSTFPQVRTAFESHKTHR